MDIDLDSYGDPNDIGPDDPAPREPAGPPDTTSDRFRVWLFDSETSKTVPDTFVVARNPRPLDFRMWVFVGRGDQAAFVMRASHRYGEGEVVPGSREDCCEVLYADASLSDEHCPDEVRALVEELTGASVLTPPKSDQSSTETDHGGPINY